MQTNTQTPPLSHTLVIRLSCNIFNYKDTNLSEAFYDSSSIQKSWNGWYNIYDYIIKDNIKYFYESIGNLL